MKKENPSNLLTADDILVRTQTHTRAHRERLNVPVNKTVNAFSFGTNRQK